MGEKARRPSFQAKPQLAECAHAPADQGYGNRLIREHPYIDFRSCPNSRPSSGNVCFAPDFVCFTPNSRHSRASAGLPLVTHNGSRGSPIRDTLYRRFQPFRHLHDCSDCFRLERWPGGTCTHWKSAALPRRTTGRRFVTGHGYCYYPWTLGIRKLTSNTGERINVNEPKHQESIKSRHKG